MLRSFLDLSSGHLTLGTRVWLDEVLHDPRHTLSSPVYGGITAYGWFVYAPEDPDEDLPADLVRVLTQARQEGAEYVLLDCDALLRPDLPVLHPDFQEPDET
jgi:hypothetical protein